jgi:hypothetical protein
MTASLAPVAMATLYSALALLRHAIVTIVLFLSQQPVRGDHAPLAVATQLAIKKGEASVHDTYVEKNISLLRIPGSTGWCGPARARAETAGTACVTSGA